tara:strand:+ start:144 stop:890 length:747 start_codon:yes stop_codon:yes gene_type:complete
MRNKIKKLIRKFGYDISRINKKYDIINFDELIAEKISEKNPVILDVGANTGQSVKRFKKIFNDPIIHSFEPNRDAFDIMKKNFKSDNKVFCNNFALGDKDEEKNLNITAFSGKSSFYNVNLDTEWTKDREYTTRIIDKKKVKISTLDNYVEQKKIDLISFLKIDTQLFEDKVLEGSLRSLEKGKVKVILVEILFNDYYEKYFSFSDIEKFLIPNNFRMCGIDLMNNNIFKGSLFGANVYYFNKKFFKI